jgi:anthranilate phosphoribosyltransferase
MQYVGKVRQEIGIRTIFNMLGPLLNPGNVQSQIVGVYSEEVQNIYGNVLKKMNRNKSIIVSGGNGMDEININGENKILVPGQEMYNFNASSIGINNQDEKELDGGDATYNANRIKEIFSGKIDAFYEIVLLNSAFALSLNDLDKLDNNVVKNNYLIAKEIIDSGKAMAKLKQLIEFTQDK